MSQLSINTSRTNLSKLKELYHEKGITLPAQVQPEPIVFEGACNAWYSSTRHGKTTRVWLVEVRKDTVWIKDQPTDKHSRSLSLAKFVKFYKQA